MRTQKVSREEHVHQVANEFSIELMYELAEHYHTTIAVVIQVFDKANYWRCINNDEVMCVQAHSGVEEVIERLEETFNEVLSRNNI